MSTPPTTCSGPSGSERRTTARMRCRRRAAGSRRASPAPARCGRASGTRTRSSARAGRASRRRGAPRSPSPIDQSWVAVCSESAERDQHPRERDDDGAHADRRVGRHERRDRDGVRGPGRAGRRARGGSPRSPPETSPPEPSATSATPANETAAAIQKRRVSRSRPSTIPKRRREDGITPSRSPTVEAALTFSA